MDSVWNYGLFDFNEPHFVYRFVKGETDYMVGGYPFSWFMPEYRMAGRRVLEQELNLTQEEAHRLLQNLRVESLPENRTYRYNYVRDNCATRITTRLETAVGERIIFPDTLAFGTFRNEMRHFHRDYPWYQFGIDLALGSGLDTPLRANDEMFVPMVMAERYEGARLPDGRQLVKRSAELAPYTPDATLPPTPWYLTPLFCASLLFLLSVIICIWQARAKKIFRPVYSLWFMIIGLTGCLVAFLVFISRHEATSPNMLILWLNPLQLVIGLGIWWRSWRRPVTAIAWYNIIVVSLMLMVWPFQAQSANPAFFPLMGATLAMAVTYAILAPRISYNKNKRVTNEQAGHIRIGRDGGSGRDTSGRRGKTAAGGRNRR